VPRPRRRLPAEAVWAEHVVGLLDLERATHEPLGADEFNRALAEGYAAHGAPPRPPLATADLAAVRALRSELAARWMALAPGATLQLAFPPDAAA
jgi:hypothetical protein